MRYPYYKNGKRHNKKYNKLLIKYLREGYITESEIEKYGQENESILIGLGKTRMLKIRMKERLNSVMESSKLT